MMWKSDRSWCQEDYNLIKRLLPEAVEFNGPDRSPSGGTRTFEIDLGNRVTVEEAVERARDAQQSLEEGGIEVVETYLDSGYRGATNSALILVVEVEG